MMTASPQKSWTTVTLGEVAKIERAGVSPESIRSGTTYVGLENIASGGAFVGVGGVCNGELASTKFAFSSKHVLYGKLRPYLAKIACPDFEGICSTDILPILPGSKLDRRFLCYFLRQPNMIEYATSRCSGANLPRLSPTTLAEFEIPLPPLSEQKRIADILDKADAIRRKRQEVVAAHESLLSTAFAHCVGRSAKGHDDWPQTTLGDLANFVGGSSLPIGEHFEGQKGGLLLVKVGDMNLPGNEVRMSIAREWIASAENKYAFCPRHAIVIPKRGGAIGTNKKRLLDRDGLLDPNLMGIVPKKVAHAAWLFQWFQHFDLLQLVSGSAVPQLNKKDLSPLVLLEPPSKNLTLFDNASEAIRKSQNLAINAAKEAGDLFNSLVQRAFKGEL